MITFPYQANIQLPGARAFAEWTVNPLLGGTSAATTVTLSGPTSGILGLASSNFTDSLDGTYTGTITPSDSGAGGIFTPASLSWSSSSAPETFTYTPAQTGTIPISITANPVLIVSGSPINFVVAAGPGIIVDYADPRQGTILL